jgi:perosamine synthetase
MGKSIRIKLADPGITTSDEEAVLWALQSGHLVNGSWCKAFEDKLESLTGRDHAIVTSSGTAALVSAMYALGIGPGSSVVVPSFTFPAPASAAAFLGAEVKICDVDPETFCVSPATLEPVLDDSVSLVVAIDQFGTPAPALEIESLLNPRGIPLLVDAACSLGSSINAKPCGSFGSVAIFSFHPRKIITTGEGGAVLTNYNPVAVKVRQAVNHGIVDGEFTSIGINLRLSELGASLGFTQAERLESIIERRRELANRYIDALPLQFQKQPAEASTNYQTLVAVLPKTLSHTHRTHLLEYLMENGIEANIASYCLGENPALQQRLGSDSIETPVALSLHQRAIALPLHPSLSDRDVDDVIQTMGTWLFRYGIT